MNLLQLWASLDSHLNQLGRLHETQVKYYLRSHSPTTLKALQKAENGEATEDDLRIASRFFSYYIDHQKYEDLLRLYDSSLSFDAVDHAHSTFVGRGAGGTSLACYRKVRLKENGISAFEKLYRLGTPHFQRNRWFHRKVFHRIQEDTRPAIPKLISVRKGKIFAACYFEYIDGLRSFLDIEPRESFTTAMATAYSDLIQSFARFNGPRGRRLNSRSDFRIGTYRDGFRRACAFLKPTHQDATTVKQIETALLNHPEIPRSFCHGDLSTENFFVNGLIDFDNCGWYPIGFDAALMLSLTKEFDTTEELLAWATYQCSLTLDTCTHQLTFLFFCFVFYCRRKRGIVASGEWLRALWNEILILFDRSKLPMQTLTH